MALRQSLGLIQCLLHLAGQGWRVPDVSTISRRQRTLQVQLPFQRSTTALDLLVGSTGLKFLGEGEWKRKKHGAEYRRQWRKVHLGIDANALEIRAIEVTDSSAQCSLASLPAVGAQDLEEVERLPPPKFGGNQDALLQTTGRAGDGAHV